MLTATGQPARVADVVAAAISGMRSSSGMSVPHDRVSARSTTSSVFAMAARSSTLLMLGDASPPVTRCTGWSSQSKKRRWISSASQPPYDVPRAPCSAISTLLVFRMLSPMVSQSMLARSSQRRSMTSASTSPTCSTASRT